jgi:hypothetical protein
MNEIFKTFGFKNFSDYFDSIIYIKPLIITVPVAAMGAFVEDYLGMKWLTLVAFISLLLVEVGSGVVASMYTKKDKFSSIRFGRFLFKAGFWVILFFILHSFEREYEVGTVMNGLFGYLYDAIMIFVVQQYLLSFIENIGKISGKSNNVLIKLIVNKVSKVIDVEGVDKAKLED